MMSGTSLVVQWLGLCHANVEGYGFPPGLELGSTCLETPKDQNIKQKQYGKKKKSNKDFKNSPCQKVKEILKSKNMSAEWQIFNYF